MSDLRRMTLQQIGRRVNDNGYSSPVDDELRRRDEVVRALVEAARSAADPVHETEFDTGELGGSHHVLPDAVVAALRAALAPFEEKNDAARS